MTYVKWLSPRLQMISTLGFLIYNCKSGGIPNLRDNLNHLITVIAIQLISRPPIESTYCKMQFWINLLCQRSKSIIKIWTKELIYYYLLILCYILHALINRYSRVDRTTEHCKYWYTDASYWCNISTIFYNNLY